MEVNISYPLALLAGLVSFLSPCVLPVVPSYLVFVTGVTLEEFSTESRPYLRRAAAWNALLFGLGFGLVFMTLGLTGSQIGTFINRNLPLISRTGGLLVILYGLRLLLRRSSERSVSDSGRGLPFKATNDIGKFLVGVTFGAGWTPCIGPILASILLYAGLEETAMEGMSLLSVYGLGLGIPFFLAAAVLGIVVAGLPASKNWIVPVQRIAGTLLILTGLFMLTGDFAALNSTLAKFDPLIELEIP